MPRAGSHYNLGTSRGPDKIGSRAGPGPRAVSCTWLGYNNTFTQHSVLEWFFGSFHVIDTTVRLYLFSYSV